MKHNNNFFEDTVGEIGNAIDFLCGGTCHYARKQAFEEAAKWPRDNLYGFYSRGDTGITKDYVIEHLSKCASLFCEESPESTIGMILNDLVDLVDKLPVAASKAFATSVYSDKIPSQTSELIEPISNHAKLCLNTARTLERFFKSVAISGEIHSYEAALNRTLGSIIRLKTNHLQYLIKSIEHNRQYRGVTNDGKESYRISLDWPIYKIWRKSMLGILADQLGNLLPAYKPATSCILGRSFFALGEQMYNLANFSIQHDCYDDSIIDSIFFHELDNIKAATLSSLANFDRQVQQDMAGIEEAETDHVQENIGRAIKKVNESQLQEDIKNAIGCSIKEIGICIKNECFIASIALTGRVFEACLKQLLAINGLNISQLKNEGINALWTMVEKSRSTTIANDLHISEKWLDILCYYRNMNVHDQTNRGLPPVPSENQAAAALNICMDLLDRTIVAAAK